MKTKQEIREADETEERIKFERLEADRQAYIEYNKATLQPWKEYESIWKPAREKWEKFSIPYFMKLQKELAANEMKEEKSISEVRKDWQICPKCGATANRFQTFCSVEKCNTNLITTRELNNAKA